MRSDDNGPLRIVRGTVDTNTPSIAAGAGFTVAKNTVGKVTITFTNAFSSVPSITLASRDVPGVNYQLVLHVATPTTTTFTVQVLTQAFAPQDGTFWFIAAGPA